MTIFEQTLTDLGLEVEKTVRGSMAELDHLDNWQQELMCAELDAIRADIEAAVRG